MKENLAIVLMLKILDLVKGSGANEREATCALQAAEAMIPESGLAPFGSTSIQAADAQSSAEIWLDFMRHLNEGYEPGDEF